MKISSCRPGLERGSVTQRRSQHLDAPPGVRDQGRGISLALGCPQSRKVRDSGALRRLANADR